MPFLQDRFSFFLQKGKRLSQVLVCLVFFGSLWSGVWSQVFPVPRAQAAASTHVGVLAKRSGTGSQSVTGVGFQPKAVIFYWTRQTTNGTSAGTENYFGAGFTTGTTQERAVSVWSDQATILLSASSDAARRTSESSMILIQSTNGAVVGAAELTSFDVDGFTLNWTTSNTSGYLVRYVAIGGSDIENVQAGTVSLNTSFGTQAVSGVGFRPDALMFLSGGTSTHGSDVSDGKFSLGFATEEDAVGYGTLIEDNVLLTSSTCSQERTDAMLVLLADTCNNADARVSLESTESDGFTLSIDDAPSSAVDVFYLAVQGGSHQVGVFTSATTTGVQAIPTEFEGHTLLLAGHNKTTSTSVTANAAITFGAATSSAAGSIASNDWQGLLPDAEARTNSVLYTAIENTTPVLTREASLDGFASSEATLDWTTNNGTAVEMLFWLIGDSPTYSQAAYRWYANTDSTDVGGASAAQDTPYTLLADGEEVRLRLVLRAESGKTFLERGSFVWQFVDRGTGTCAAPSGGSPAGYTNITTTTDIAFFDNTTPTNGEVLTVNANDPTDGGNPVYAQTYHEQNPFLNTEHTFVQGEDGLWDVSLVDFGAPPNTTYCFRAAASDGTPLLGYDVYPTLTTQQYLSVDVVDDSENSVASPAVVFPAKTSQLFPQTSATTLGTSEEKIRVENFTNNPSWSLTLAADGGSASVWDAGGGAVYDYNDPTAGTADGGDGDAVGGQLAIDATSATLSPGAGCTSTGFTLGSSEQFGEGVVDVITLMSTGGTAETNCLWDVTGVDVTQTIPGSQSVGNYAIDMTLTVTAI